MCLLLLPQIPQQLTDLEIRKKELERARDLYEHKMHMAAWDLLMLERYEAMKKTKED
jgi:hypothetical protein